MKFECIHNHLLLAVEQVAKARSKNTQHLILQDIFISLSDHQLTLRATNLEITCEKTIPVKGIQNGTCLVSGDILVKAIQGFKSKKTVTTCEVIEGVFLLSSENDVIEIKINNKEDFPTLPKQGDEIVSIDQKTLSLLFREVLFCAAQTDIKPEIATVYIYNKDGFLISVATDVYRLAEKRIKYDIESDIYLLIPQKHIMEMLSIFESEEGDEEGGIVLYKNENIITLIKNTITISMHILSGQFPDYRQLFPKEFTTTVQVKKEDLIQALQVTSLFTENYSPLSCQINKNTLVLHTKNEKTGKATQTIQVTTEGEEIAAYYNNKYFLDVFPHLEGKDITLGFTVATRPIVIQSKESNSFTYLLMPVNR